MQQNIKPITKRLLIAALILILITAVSFGIRQVRFSARRADTLEPTSSARPSNTEGQHELDKSLNAEVEPDYYQDGSYTAADEQDLQYVDGSDWDEEMFIDVYSEMNTDSIKYDKAISMTKSFKGDYVKAEGKKDLKKISLSDHENLYLTKEAEAWYVSEQPDGSTAKIQVQINEYTGELTAVDGDYYVKSEGSQGPYRIPMGENEDIYLTEEGQVWYVTEQPDGSTAKIQVQVDDNTDEITVVDSGDGEE
jgi:hypothetical protein